MTEDLGHFENGRWVIDVKPTIQAEEPKKDDQIKSVEEMIENLKSNISTSFDGIISLTHHIVTTESGHKYVENKVNETISSLDKEVNELMKKTRETLKKYIDL